MKTTRRFDENNTSFYSKQPIVLVILCWFLSPFSRKKHPKFQA